MGQTLTNGVYLPDNGERNCYTGLSQNWQKLDNLIGSHGDSVSFSQTLTEGVEIGKITINGTEISMYHTDYSSKADASNVYTKTEIDTSLSSKANASDLTTHTSNADIHVTSTDKATWNGKQSALTDAQLNACNSGITSTKVSSYDTHVANSDVHVTTSDKSTWNAKQNALTDTQLSACNSGITSDKVSQYDGYATSKANDSDVVHKSGNETINGVKTFYNLRTYFGRDVSCYSKVKYGKKLNPTSNSYQYLNFSGNTASDGATNDWSGGYLEQVITPDGLSRGRWFIQDTSENPVGVELFVKNNDRQFRPYKNGTTDLGTSTQKWKTINGINPGALSLPDYSKGFSIIGNFNPTSTTDKGSWTATCDCIIYVCVVDGEGSFCVTDQLHHWFRSGINTGWGYATIWFFVRKGDRVTLANFGSSQGYNTGSFVFVIAYPCQGNV